MCMKSFVKDSGRVLGKNWPSLVLFELIYRILTTSLLMRYVKLAMKLSLRKLGHSYLTAETFVQFISYPVTIFFIVIGILAMTLAMLFEIQALFVCYESSWNNQKTSVPLMIVRGAAMTVQFVRKYPLRCFLYMALSGPFMGIHFLVSEIFQTRILQFIITQIGNTVQDYPLLILILIVVYFVSLLFSLSLPERVQMKKASAENYRKILRSDGGTGIKTVLNSILVQLAAALSVIIFYVLAMVVMVGIVRLTRVSNTMVSAVLFYGRVVKYVTGIIAGGVGFTFTLLYLYVLYMRSGIENAAEKEQISNSRKISNKIQIPKVLIRIFNSRFAAYAVTFFLLASQIGYVALEIRRDLSGVGETESDVAVTAHRGGARMAPENTLSSMKYAIDALADVAEIDVQETKDGKIVLLHDTNLKRTTGFNANIWDVTYDQVSQLDAGVKFNKKYVGEQVPTLDEVIRYCKGKIKLNIEVKYNGHNKGIVKKVIRVIEKNHFEEDCVVTSMNYKFLQQVKQENPDIKTGYTLKMTYGDLSDLSEADFFSVKHTYISERFVSQVHKLGKEVHAWTLNYQGDMQRMLSANVNNIITDEPELVRKVVLGETDRNPSFLTLLRYALH